VNDIDCCQVTRRQLLVGVSAMAASSSGAAAATAMPTRLIDVHAHFLPAAYRQALARAGLKTLDGGMPIPTWNAADALAVMDRHAIGTAVLSISSPSVHFIRGRAAIALARAVNEEAASLMRAHPGRFGCFATLPLGNMRAALAELAYALDNLDLDGIALETNTHGKYLGHAYFRPLFDELNRRRAVVFLHPTSPACLAQIGLGRPAPMIEFPFDTTRTISDLLFSGTLQRCPDLQLIVPHGGGTLPMLAGRLAGFAALGVMQTAIDSPADIPRALARLYYDLAAATAPGQFAALRALAPITQLLYGSDYPFTPEVAVAAGMAALNRLPDLSEGERAAIARENALRLFPRLRGAAGV
jgi:predicted TIM-barrel fold metal-dependent hydrolase